jgi:tRNA-dihydrouridine synthase B
MNFLLQTARYPLVLAPLAGWSDKVFRLICREFGASLCFTEMVSAEGLVRDNLATRQLLESDREDKPLGIQLFGSEPDVMAAAARKAAGFEPDVIDLNFGCPVKKVVRQGSGAALLQDIDRMVAIVKAVKDAVALPLWAKIRSGWNEDVSLEVCQRLEEAGVDGITVHPRLQVMHFKGTADWTIIKKVKKAVRIPVIGNGDVSDWKDTRRMFDETGCDAVMIGRAARGNPWIFAQSREHLEYGTIPNDIPADERIDICTQHLNMAAEEFGERKAVRLMRKHISHYMKGLPFISELRAQLLSLEKKSQIAKKLQEYKNILGEKTTSAAFI